MGETLRCARCGKGIHKPERPTAINREIYHIKCAERIEKNKK